MASAEVYLSDWQWIHRMELAFQAFDSDEDSFISLEDFQGWVGNVEKDLGDEANPGTISALRKVMKEYGLALGFRENDPEQITSYKFIKLMAEFTAKEKQTFQTKGLQETMIAKVNHAWFNVIHSGNFVLLEGYRRLTKATNFDTKFLVPEESTADKRVYKTLSAADFFFKTVLSEPEDGGPKKISREEMIQNQFQFFHTVNHPKGLYGPRFEHKSTGQVVQTVQ